MKPAFAPAKAKLKASIGFASAMIAPEAVERIELRSGTALSTAVVNFPTLFGEAPDVNMGDSASISIGAETVFRGVVGSVPVQVEDGADSTRVVLYCDKFRMRRFVVGQPGIGTQGADGAYGFLDVGFVLCFNENGAPNRMKDALDFCTGSNAVYWTLRSILEFIFEYYVDRQITMDYDDLDEVFDRCPSHVMLSDMRALEAVDHVIRLAGATWGIDCSGGDSEVVVVRSGRGRVRHVPLFAPHGGNSIAQASEFSASSVYGNAQIINSFTRYVARSGPRIMETTLWSGEGEMLRRVPIQNGGKHFVKYVSNVSAYAAHGLGASRSPGAKAKAWLPTLQTRIREDGSYVTAAQILEDASLLNNPCAEIKVWVAPDGVREHACLCQNGYDIDLDESAIYFEHTVTLMEFNLNSFSASVQPDSLVGVSVAVVLDDAVLFDYTQAGKYLDNDHYMIVDKPEILPVERHNLVMPKKEEVITMADSDDPERYVDVRGQIESIAKASAKATPMLECEAKIVMPGFPLVQIGNRIKMTGRRMKLTGDEVAVSVTYHVDRAYTTEIEINNTPAVVDPDHFIHRGAM